VILGQETEKMLLQSGNFRLKGKKALLNQAEIPVITVMDVTETPIESPQKKQKDFFGGKKGYHSLKSQLVADKIQRKLSVSFVGKVEVMILVYLKKVWFVFIL